MSVTLRGHLMLLACVATLPAFLFIVYIAASERQSALRKAEEEARHVATLASREHAHQIAGARRLLDRLATTDPESMQSMLPPILAGFPQVANIGILDLSGNVVYSVVPPPRRVAMAESPAFAETLRTNEVAIGQYQIGKIVGRPILLMTKSVRGKTVLFAALELTWLDELARQANLPPETSLLIADRNGTIVAGAAPTRLPGFDELTRTREGMVRVGDLLCVAVPLRDANGLWVVAGTPESTIRSIAGRVFYRDLVVLALFAAVAIAAAMVAAARHHAATQSRETLRALTHRLDTIREDEARRIAQELHDELGQQLTVLRMDLANLRRRKNLDDSIETMSETIDEAIHSVRRIASELRPGVLDRLGLTAALEWLLRELERRSSIRTELRASGVSEHVDSETATTLFRVTQEAMTNVIRHSGASSVRVELDQNADRITLRIRDDGRGFDAANVARTSLGLVGMRERVRRLGGTLEIRSAAGEGTELIATVKVEEPCFSCSSSTTTPSCVQA